MAKIYFSPSLLCFFDSRITPLASMPADKVEVSEAERAAALAGVTASKKIDADANGKPIVVDVVPDAAHIPDLLLRAKNELRAMREPMLSAVTGIGWEASEAGDDALVQEARNIRNALRDITLDPALNAAQTYEDMRAAGVAAYRRIAASASPAFAATFKEITGS